MSHLEQISPCIFYKELCNIEFTSLVSTSYNDLKEFQTKPFESPKQLVDCMKSIDNNPTFLNSVSDFYLSSKINAEHENTDVDQRQRSLDQICDILSQWFENGNINVLLDFKITIPNRNDTDYGYCEKFADCLSNKISIDINDKCNNCDEFSIDLNDVQIFPKPKFVSPYYGGSQNHFCNIIGLNNRVRVGTHMNAARLIDRGYGWEYDYYSYHYDYDIRYNIYFVVKLIKMGQKFGDKKKLIHCDCFQNRSRYI